MSAGRSATIVDGRLSLAYRDLSTIPEKILAKYAKNVVELDLTGNQLTDLRCLAEFVNLRILVLDNNGVTDKYRFSKMPRLETLWLNNNAIKNLAIFVEHLSSALPCLKHISMMNNEAAPSYFNGGRKSEYNDYR